MIKPLIGHLVDLKRLIAFDPRNPYSYSKFRQIKAMARRCRARMFVETGTYLGNTTMRCSRVFDRVITIELDDELYRKSATYLKNRSNVECIHGDASKELVKVMQRDDLRDALVFLDGHFSGGETAHGDMAEPACEEIETLARYRDKLAGFIVDDFRQFGTQSGWPTKASLLASCEKFFGDGWRIVVHLDQVLVSRKMTK